MAVWKATRHHWLRFVLLLRSHWGGGRGVGEGRVCLRLPNYQSCVKMKPQLVSDRMAWFYIRRHHSHRCDNLHHATRGHITHAPPGRVSTDCLCEALTCFLMGFGEWPAAGHFESSHDWPIHIFYLLLPKTKSFCSFLFFWDICFHLFHLPADTFVELQQSQGHRNDSRLLLHSCLRTALVWGSVSYRWRWFVDELKLYWSSRVFPAIPRGGEVTPVV